MKDIETKIIDIPIVGNAKTGDYKTNNDALDNAFRLWISSSKNEFLRQQGGNWLMRHIGKPMSQARADEIRSSIQLGIATEFIPKLTILKLDVEPDYTKRKWIITVIAYSEAYRVALNQTYLVDNE